jgi:uncharacterized membrane protein
VPDAPTRNRQSKKSTSFPRTPEDADGCEEEQEEAAREEKPEFSRINEAIEWLRAHKAEVAIGTVIIVAGVAFIVTTGGSGALILVPLAL